MSNRIIDRETYRTIKKMSGEKLQAFLMRYAEGLSKDPSTVDLQELEKDVKGIKGIGEKRDEEVMKVIDRYLGVCKVINIKLPLAFFLISCYTISERM